MKKKISLLLSVVVCIGLTVLFRNVFRSLATAEGREAFRGQISNHRVTGCLLLMGLNVVRVFLFFLPGKAMGFLVLSTLLRFPGIITSTFVGESFAPGRQGFAAAAYGLTFLISAAALYITSKREEVKEVPEINSDKN